MVFGTIIFVATLAAWLYGEQMGVETTTLWTVSTPVVMALFIGTAVGEAADAARQAAAQTNGAMDPRIKAAVAAALADRDAARTRQAVGDLGDAGSRYATPDAPERSTSVP